MITGDLKSGDFNCQKKDPICVYNWKEQQRANFRSFTNS